MGQPDAMPLSSVPCMAKRNAAVHAARALLPEFFLVEVQVELFPVPNALRGRSVERQFAQIFDKSRGFSHVVLVCLKDGPHPRPLPRKREMRARKEERDKYQEGSAKSRLFVLPLSRLRPLVAEPP